MSMTALLDGDIIQYRCGFASDKQVYVCPDGTKIQYKKDAVAHCLAEGLDKEFIVPEVTYEPVEHALHSVKLTIKGIMESIDATECQIFLTGKANFRDDLYPLYKANRDRTRKPHWFKEIGEYMVKYWDADVVVGAEADDAMGWWQWKDILLHSQLEDNETCICTLDKDLNMIPGWHYNWVADEGKGVMFLNTEEDAILYFMQQWLTGDPADNIPGLPKVGEKTAQKILEPFKQNITSVRQLYQLIANEYKKKAIDAKMMHLVGDLLWIQRTPGETWDKYLGLSKVRRENEQ